MLLVISTVAWLCDRPLKSSGTLATVILVRPRRSEQIENFNAEHGLDRPGILLFDRSRWLYGMVRIIATPITGSGCFKAILGRSFRTDRPVRDMIFERYPSTIKLAIAAPYRRVGIKTPVRRFGGFTKKFTSR